MAIERIYLRFLPPDVRLPGLLENFQINPEQRLINVMLG
jgi:hypothetical protein